MKKTFEKNQKGIIYFLAAFFALMAVVTLSCEKQGKIFPADHQQSQISSQDKSSSSISKQQALKRINDYFEDELYPVKLEQVQGISRKQFTQWLRNSKVAAAEKQFLGPLLSANVTEFVLLNNVTLRDTNRKATIALIAVPSQLNNQFTKMVAIVDYVRILNGPRTLCMWKRCDSYEPCPCICWIDFVYGTECPSDKCMWNGDCQGYNPAADCDGELSGIDAYDVIATW
jgi:hypothetical protein